MEAGSYTYTVSKDGYYTVERALEVTEPETEYVTMVEVLPEHFVYASPSEVLKYREEYGKTNDW